MSVSITQLKVFGLISSIESDLRNVLVKELNNSIDYVSFNSLTGKLKKRYKHVLDAFKKFKENKNLPDYSSIKLSNIIKDLYFRDTFNLLEHYRNYVDSNISTYIDSIKLDLTKINRIRNGIMHGHDLLHTDFKFILNKYKEFIEGDPIFWKESHIFNEQLNSDQGILLKFEHLIPSHASLPAREYDDTGFIGRKDKFEKLKYALLAPNQLYNSVVLKGFGGFGKTALAVKVAYYIVENEQNTFKEVLWYSTKTKRLDLYEIKEMKKNFLSKEVFKDISKIIHKGDDDPTNFLINYLKTTSTLLIIDNVETIDDPQYIQSFLERVSSKSRVLITSRGPFGLNNYHIDIEGLNNDESVELFKRFAKYNNDDNSKKLLENSDETIARWCVQMNNNPGYIKWFILSNIVHYDPNRVVQNNELFLQYCMENIYERLSKNTKKILKTILYLGKNSKLGELVHYSGFNAQEVGDASMELLSNKFINSNTPKIEPQYDLLDIPREYIEKFHPLSIEERSIFSKKRNELEKLYIKLKADIANDNENELNDSGYIEDFEDYSLNVTVHLLQAHEYLFDKRLQLEKSERISKAEKELKEAENVAPRFSEVHRLKALLELEKITNYNKINNTKGDYSIVNEHYKKALEFKNNSYRLYRWYAGFLVREGENPKEGLNQINLADKLKQNDPIILREKAKCLTAVAQFDESLSILNNLIIDGNIDQTSRQGKIIITQILENYFQKAKYKADRERDIPASLNSFGELLTNYNYFGNPTDDQQINNVIYDSYNFLTKLPLQNEKYKELLSSFEKILKISPEEFTGTVKWYSPIKKYGFITYQNGQDILVHKTGIEYSQYIPSSEDTVSFTTKEREGKLVAIKVKKIDNGGF